MSSSAPALPAFDPNEQMRTSSFTSRAAGSFGAVALAVSALSSLPVSAQTVLTASPLGPSGHLLNQRVLAVWADSVRKATDERVTIRVLADAVAPPPLLYEAVEQGRVDVALMSNGAVSRKLTLNAVVEFPGHTHSAEQASLAYQHLVERHQALADEFGNVELLAVFTHGPGVLLLTVDAAKRKDDLTHMKLHAGGAGAEKAVRGLGAYPVVAPGPDATRLLQDATVDGTVTALEAYVGFGLTDLIGATVTSPGGFYTAGFSLVVNRATWNALDARDREAIRNVSGTVVARLAGRAWDEGDVDALRCMKAAATSITSVDPASAARLSADADRRVESWAQAAGNDEAEARTVLAEYRREADAPLSSR